MGIVWLRDAVFYEIYPQTFFDTDGDGIGDLQGIIEKLDYVKSLGCNALWINPCFDSPFKDAGYDVRDYYTIAPRYGTNEDMYRLFREAHAKGIRVCLDLVPGHTSEEHPWFIESSKAERNALSARYIWSDCWFTGMPGHIYIGGESPRDGVYMLNFFKCQPALNYGFRKPSATWQLPLDAPACLETRDAITDVIRFWLSHGADGFRVDMADSLCKDDDGNKSGTAEIWRSIFASIRKDYPEAAFISEWSNPRQAIAGAGFDCDFYLNHMGNGINTLVRDYETPGGDHSYFKMDAGGDINRFLTDYRERLSGAAGQGYTSFITCNHDTPRLAPRLTVNELKLAYAFFFTMPGVPFLYYGDELGMNYIPGLPTKEGGYTRTGTRTPMQWNSGKNLGFSRSDTPYLPVDCNPGAVTVEQCSAVPDSLFCTLKQVIALRHSEPDLQADADFEAVCHNQGEPFLYRRGKLLLAVNPDSTAGTVRADFSGYHPLFTIGTAELNGNALTIGAQSFVVLK